MKRLLKCLALSVLVFYIQLPAFSQLIDNGDGTITDTNTGLMWLKDINQAGSPMNWDEANQWVSSLNFAGYDDWRLPSGDTTQYNLGELGSLCFGYPLMTEGCPFTNMSYGGYYWTSTEVDASNALAFPWFEPNLISRPKTDGLLVWAVRTIPSGAPEIEVDVWIKDCWNDYGREPSSCAGESVDIFIDNDYDGKIDLPVGWYSSYPNAYENTVKAWIRNNSDAWLIARVGLYKWNCTTEATFTESDRVDPGTIYKQVMVEPKGRSLVIFNDVLLPNLIANGDDWCLGVKVSHDDDLASPIPVDPREDNNIATASLTFIAEREGQDASLIWWRTFRGMWFALVLIAIAVLSIEWFFARNYFRRGWQRIPD